MKTKVSGIERYRSFLGNVMMKVDYRDYYYYYYYYYYTVIIYIYIASIYQSKQLSEWQWVKTRRSVTNKDPFPDGRRSESVQHQGQ